MARPATKQDLEFLAKENYQKLLSLIETLPEKQREDSFSEGTMNRNLDGYNLTRLLLSFGNIKSL